MDRRPAVPLEHERRGIEAHCLGQDVVDVYGFGANGASLVRPDGFVAWRGSDAGGLADALRAAVRR